MAKPIRYVKSSDLPAITRAAEKQKCNRILTWKRVNKLVEQDINMPLVFEMLHERGPRQEIRVIAVIDTEARTVVFDIPIKLRHLIRTWEEAVPDPDPNNGDETMGLGSDFGTGNE